MTRATVCASVIAMGALPAACGRMKPSIAANPRDTGTHGADGGDDGISPTMNADAAPDAVPSSHTEPVTVVVAGQGRLVIVHVPGAPRGPLPLVFNLHGSGGTGADEEIYSDMDRAADALGFIAAYPQGAIALGGGFAWNVPGQPLTTGDPVPPDALDDVAYFADSVAVLRTRFSIDAKRVYATGISGGGRMASQLACDLSTTFAAVAPVAGLRFPLPCNSVRPMPVVAFHGTADTVNPYLGGGPAYWTISVPDAAQAWADHNGCTSPPTVSPAASAVELRTYVGCAGDASVALYTIDGGGHEWPGAPQQTQAIDATAAMWTFFTSHALP